MTVLRPAAACAALLLTLAATGQARVFDGAGRAPGYWATLPGWERAYAAPLLLNGAPADLEIWNAPERLHAALDRLRERATAAGEIAVFLPGPDMAWGVTAGGGRVHRVFATAMESGRQTLVFRFSQSESDFRAAPRHPPLPDGIPAFPGASPAFQAVNRTSRTTFAVYTASAQPADVHAYYARALASRQWSPALGAAEPAAMGFFLRQDALCGVAAKKARQTGLTVITVVHRRLSDGATPPGPADSPRGAFP